MYIKTAKGWERLVPKLTPPTPIEDCLPWKPQEMGKSREDGGIKKDLHGTMRAYKSLNVR